MHRRLVRVCRLVVVPIACLSCRDESVAPAGTPATVLVRAYVDADGSAGYSAGDAAIAGQPVELASGGAATRQATTDAAGIATFTDVAPGSYVASFAGTPPAGALLATAQEASVTAPFQGGDVQAEFRFVYLPGSLTGTVFRDENANATYEAGTDTPGWGIIVALFAGSPPAADTLATDTTAADGQFTFTALRPGAYTVGVRSLSPDIQIAGGTEQAVQATADAQTPLAFRFTGSLATSIAQARLSPGDTVVIEGVISVAQGTFRTQNDNAYLQDGSSGVQVFNVPTTLGLGLGDSVGIAGIMGVFSGEQQIVQFNASTPPIVVRFGTTTAPSPRSVTGADIKALSFQGELVSVTNVQLVAAPSPGTTAYNLNFVHAATDTFQVRIEAGVVPSVPRTGSWTSGAFYDLTGVLGRFNAVAQLKPRGAADIVAR